MTAGARPLRAPGPEAINTQAIVQELSQLPIRQVMTGYI